MRNKELYQLLLSVESVIVGEKFDNLQFTLCSCNLRSYADIVKFKKFSIENASSYVIFVEIKGRETKLCTVTWYLLPMVVCLSCSSPRRSSGPQHWTRTHRCSPTPVPRSLCSPQCCTLPSATKPASQLATRSGNRTWVRYLYEKLLVCVLGLQEVVRDEDVTSALLHTHTHVAIHQTFVARDQYSPPRWSRSRNHRRWAPSGARGARAASFCTRRMWSRPVCWSRWRSSSSYRPSPWIRHLPGWLRFAELRTRRESGRRAGTATGSDGTLAVRRDRVRSSWSHHEQRSRLADLAGYSYYRPDCFGPEGEFDGFFERLGLGGRTCSAQTEEERSRCS